MMPTLANLLANRLIVWESGTLPGVELQIPNLSERLTISDMLLNHEGVDYSNEHFCRGILGLESEVTECLVNAQIEKQKLDCWLQDEYGNAKHFVFSNPDILPENKEARDHLYQKLITAQMVRHGYSIHEEIGIGFTVLDLAGQSAFTNLARCDCAGFQKNKTCEHILFAREYNSPGNRKLMKGVKFEYVAA